MLNSLLVSAGLAAYFLVLLLIARHTSRHTGGKVGDENDAFFRASRSSPWWMVAFGMIGASISGVTFVSVPGWAASTGMTYLQMCAGFVPGYFAVAFVLLPLYYGLRLTSIYSYLGNRFGRRTHRTGAFFFLLSKLTGAAARLYLTCIVLELFLVPHDLQGGWFSFLLVVLAVLGLIWGYTRKTGLQTIVRTDALQTLCLLLAGGGILWAVMEKMQLSPSETLQLIGGSDMGRVFCFDPGSPQYFWRQFLSGFFIVVVMTGLDQDMMQKNLSCRSLREAQKNMCSYGLAFLPVNLLFLALGVLLYSFVAQTGAPDGGGGDALLPTLVASGTLGVWVAVPFTVGVCAAAFSSADSALTALTTTCCIDLLGMEERKMPPQRAVWLRRRVHLAVTAAFVACIVVFRWAGGTSVINAIYVMAGYTYGPLLGLYSFGLFTRRKSNDKLLPYIALASPAACAVLDAGAPLWWNYRFGYELLMLNGALTFAGAWLCSRRG